MRTTLTLDDDVARQLESEMRRTGDGLKQVVNAALRRGLRTGGKPAPRPDRFVVEPVDVKFRPGIDPARLNQLVDELEVEEFLAKQSRMGTKR